MDIKKPKITSPDDEAILESEKAKPSSDPAFWAKRSCTSCHGRGIVGTQTSMLKGNNTIKQELLCACAQRRFSRWRDQFVRDYKANSFQKQVEDEIDASIRTTAGRIVSDTDAASDRVVDNPK